MPVRVSTLGEKSARAGMPTGLTDLAAVEYGLVTALLVDDAGEIAAAAIKLRPAE